MIAWTPTCSSLPFSRVPCNERLDILHAADVGRLDPRQGTWYVIEGTRAGSWLSSLLFQKAIIPYYKVHGPRESLMWWKTSHCPGEEEPRLIASSVVNRCNPPGARPRYKYNLTRAQIEVPSIKGLPVYSWPERFS